ncbi:RHOMBOID-like protein [Vigna angularis]|uniref:RHOMBOID-like protein n=1 Tax=Phaseolus angularis TaxID=3914 RepID=A0A8T0JE27_PHAAN|nr:RHOMBOID-like protein [Vigna angularis]
MGKKPPHQSDIEAARYPPPPPPNFYIPQPPLWFSWLVPLIFLANIACFVYTMYENDCPAYLNDESCLFSEYLGRFSFQPFRENPLLGPAIRTIGLLYVLSSFGGSLLSILHLKQNRSSTVSVGASGALFGLLGAMLSELLTNWSIYANKCAALASLLIIVGLNLAVGFLPHVDNSAHVGGFLTGYFLGFVLLMRPQYGYVNRKYIPPGYDVKRKSKYKWYQYFYLFVSLVILILG